MPANLTPEYKAAEAAYKTATDPRDRLVGLKDMLRTIPKHKGTEHLRADIKTRIKDLTEELASAKKTGARGGSTVIRPEGSAQVALIGPPNTGKSALHARLTGSHAEVGPYPFATQYPLPGMLMVDDVSIQLVDQPSVSPDHPIPWIGNALQTADAAAFIVDLSRPGCVESAVLAHEILAERRIVLSDRWPVQGSVPVDDDAVPDPFTTILPTVLIANKADLIDEIEDELQILEELAEISYPALTASVETGEGLDRIGPWLFEQLGIVRVYTKIPGAPVDKGRPFTVRVGQTVGDVALLVHRDIAASFQYARIWGESSYDGQQVGKDHPVVDGDVVELHT